MPDNFAITILENLLPWLLFAGLISILGAVFRFFLLPKIKGRIGEKRINSRIHKQLDPAIYHLLADVMLPVSDGTTQIDHVVVSRYGIFVLETKNYTGWIFGDPGKAKWTQVIYKKKSQFQNPLRQNYKHVKTLCDLTGLPENYFVSLAVFAGDCTFKTTMPENVVYARDVVSRIRSFTKQIIPDERVLEIVATINQCAAGVSEEQRAMHLTNLRRTHHKNQSR